VIGLIVVEIGDRAAVEQRHLVKVVDQNRMVRRDTVELLDGRQAFFLELEFGKPAGDPDELALRCPVRLQAQNVKCFFQAVRRVPANFKVVVDAAADRVRVAVDQTGDDAFLVRADHLRERADQRSNIGFVSDGNEPAATRGKCRRLRARRIHCCDASVKNDQVRKTVLGLGEGRGQGAGGQKRGRALEKLTAVKRHDLSPAAVQRRLIVCRWGTATSAG